MYAHVCQETQTRMHMAHIYKPRLRKSKYPSGVKWTIKVYLYNRISCNNETEHTSATCNIMVK